MKYLFFDLDGTLCESKQNLKREMVFELTRLMDKYEIVIVSGGPLERIIVQAPLNVLFMGQNGNTTHKYGGINWTNELPNKDAIMQHIDLLAKEMKIDIIPDMIEDRGSQISFSFVGHNAPIEVKSKFDLDRKKRSALLDKFPFHNAFIGGTTSIDYIPKTKGENIQRYLDAQKINACDCLYIGDALKAHGNDETVVGVIPTFLINSPGDTLKFIKNL